MGINKEARRRANCHIKNLPMFSKKQLVRLCDVLGVTRSIGRRWNQYSSEELQKMIRSQIGRGTFADRLNRFADEANEFMTDSAKVPMTQAQFLNLRDEVLTEGNAAKIQIYQMHDTGPFVQDFRNYETPSVGIEAEAVTNLLAAGIIYANANSRSSVVTRYLLAEAKNIKTD